MGLNATNKSNRNATNQQGSVLLFSLVVLLLMFLGALFALRGELTDTSLTDHFSERQKNILASDLALQWVANQINSVGSSRFLEISATNQSWFLNVQPANAVTPTPSYWSTCMSSSTSTDTCAQAKLTTTTTPSAATPTQTAWVFVQPTGRTDASACNTQGLTAVYYDIWVHTIDARSQVRTDTESVYKLCVR